MIFVNRTHYFKALVDFWEQSISENVDGSWWNLNFLRKLPTPHAIVDVNVGALKHTHIFVQCNLPVSEDTGTYGCLPNSSTMLYSTLDRVSGVVIHAALVCSEPANGRITETAYSITRTREYEYNRLQGIWHAEYAKHASGRWNRLHLGAVKLNDLQLRDHHAHTQIAILQPTDTKKEEDRRDPSQFANRLYRLWRCNICCSFCLPKWYGWETSSSSSSQSIAHRHCVFFSCLPLGNFHHVRGIFRVLSSGK